jgi:Integrase core domain
MTAVRRPARAPRQTVIIDASRQPMRRLGGFCPHHGVHVPTRAHALPTMVISAAAMCANGAPKVVTDDPGSARRGWDALHDDQLRYRIAGSFPAACERLGVAQSMGRPGSALDNAVIESWHSTLEFELRSLHNFAIRAAARTAVAAWIENYNHVRRHSALGMHSPVDYERFLAGKDAA